MLVSAISCAPSADVKTTVETPKKKQTNPKTEKEKTAWSIQIPEGWNKETEPESTRLNDPKNVLVADKTYIVDGAEVDVHLSVVVGRIPPELSKDFPAELLRIVDSRNRTEILDKKNVELGDVVGLEWIECRRTDSNAILGLISVAVAKDGLAVYSMCGGSMNSPAQSKALEVYLADCQKILESIRLN